MSEVTKLNHIFQSRKIDKETLNIQIFDNKILMTIVGEFNSNLLELEKLTNTNIFFRGNSITIKGKTDNNKKVFEAIKFLINKFILTNSIEKNDITLSVKRDIYDEKNSNIQSLNQLIKTPRRSVIARSEKQAQYIKALTCYNLHVLLSNLLSYLWGEK